MAIDDNHTNIILTMTRFRVLLRPKRIGYRSDRYRSIDIVHKCIILAVQNNTSKQIHARQCTDFNGKRPENENERKKLFQFQTFRTKC